MSGLRFGLLELELLSPGHLGPSKLEVALKLAPPNLDRGLVVGELKFAQILVA